VAAQKDIVFLGAGHNALVAAFYLARAGRKPLLLERRDVVGGCAITDEFYPGFMCSTLAHATGPLAEGIAQDMQLDRHGLHMLAPDPRLFAPTPDGRALVLYGDPGRSAQSIAPFSQHDALTYPEFAAVLQRFGKVLGQVMPLTPPALEGPSAGDVWKLLPVGRRFRALGRAEMFRLLRWGPMCVADLVSEFFENELVRATIAARGVFGAHLGPWSAGSALLLLLRAACDPHPGGSASFPRGGVGALTQAMAAAAKAAGAEIRTGAAVAQIVVKNGAATGVVLEGGEEITARAVVSGADPKRTLLGLVDPAQLDPGFATKIRNFRARGVTAKVNLALDGLPRFTAAAQTEVLMGRIHIGPEVDYLERAFDAAKYGEFSQQPYLDVMIPSLSDPTLAPHGQQVMSVTMQYAPPHLKAGDWTTQRDALADAVVKTLAQYAPDLPAMILHRQVITPADLEQTYGLTGGQIFHGELALDQVFTMRPILKWARYATPIRNLFLCGSGTHPGTGLTGASGRNAAREIAAALRA
jgi:phytoene dehydrogenase-like protein